MGILNLNDLVPAATTSGIPVIELKSAAPERVLYLVFVLNKI